MYRPNPLLKTLREGRPAIGMWLSFGDPMITEIFALAGFDAVLIDHEHAPIGIRETVGHLQALAASPCAGIVRVPWNDAVAVKRVLDIGAEGIMFPAIETAEEARAAVAATRYPPRGTRGAAIGSVRASDYGLATSAYVETVNDNLIVICQIESAAAVDAIPEIAAVDGVDMLVVGPTDLSGSIGRFAQFNDPEVAALVAKAERLIKDSGVWLAGIGSLGRTAAEMAADGHDLVFTSIDTTFLAQAAAGEVRKFRKRADGSGDAR